MTKGASFWSQSRSLAMKKKTKKMRINQLTRIIKWKALVPTCERFMRHYGLDWEKKNQCWPANTSLREYRPSRNPFPWPVWKHQTGRLLTGFWLRVTRYYEQPITLFSRMVLFDCRLHDQRAPNLGWRCSFNYHSTNSKRVGKVGEKSLIINWKKLQGSHYTLSSRRSSFQIVMFRVLTIRS